MNSSKAHWQNRNKQQDRRNKGKKTNKPLSTGEQVVSQGGKLETVEKLCFEGPEEGDLETERGSTKEEEVDEEGVDEEASPVEEEEKEDEEDLVGDKDDTQFLKIFVEPVYDEEGFLIIDGSEGTVERREVEVEVEGEVEGEGEGGGKVREGRMEREQKSKWRTNHAQGREEGKS
jgi:hypothetical protein